MGLPRRDSLSEGAPSPSGRPAEAVASPCRTGHGPFRRSILASLLIPYSLYDLLFPTFPASYVGVRRVSPSGGATAAPGRECWDASSSCSREGAATSRPRRAWPARTVTGATDSLPPSLPTTAAAPPFSSRRDTPPSPAVA